MNLCSPEVPVMAEPLPADEVSEVGRSRRERNAVLKLLIAASAGGDMLAFENLYATTATWLLGRIRRIAGDFHAEDVLADVYVQVWRTLASYHEGRGEPLAWLATIARSRAIDCLRTERLSHAGGACAPSSDFDEPHHTSGPEEVLSAAEDARLVQVALGALTPKERLVLGMAYFRDCSQQEIAASTGIRLGTVKSLMTRSQRKLRDVLACAKTSSDAQARPMPQAGVRVAA